MLLVYASVCFRYFSLIPIFLLINLHLSIYYPNIAEQKKQNMIPIDEKHIIKKLKAGDNEAYKYIYDYHYVALCKLSYYLLKDRVQAESIVNDVISVSYTHLKLIEKPIKTILFSCLILIAGIVLSGVVGKDFLPELDEGSIWLQVNLPPGISVEKSREMSDTLRSRTMKYPEVTLSLIHILG